MQVQPSLITPGEPFDIYYFLRNPTDLSTYYIKAVIYDVRSGQQITTVTLTQSSVNAHLFVSTLQAPSDPSATGRNIVAIASVYTDSGYTTKSDAYEEQESYFLVKSQLPFTGGGGIDYSAVREIVEDIAKKYKSPDSPDMPFEKLFGAIGALQREMNRVPKDKVSLAPVLSAVAGVQRAISELPQPESVDLQPVIAEIRALPAPLLQAIDALPDRLSQKLSAASDALKTTGTAIMDAIRRTFDEAANKVVAHASTALDRELGKKEITLSIGNVVDKSGEKTTPEPSPMTLDHLFNQ